MESYIAMLRGINVSGQKKVDMVGLKAMFEEMHFTDVATYIQSGNIVFNSKRKDQTALEKEIEEGILKKYSFAVPTIIKTVSELRQIINQNPFMGSDVENLYVTFLFQTPQESAVEKLGTVNYDPDKFIIKKQVVYLVCGNGYGNTKLNNNFFENKLKVKATTRNWKTVNKLFEMANLISSN